jgi:hypothetical protein
VVSVSSTVLVCFCTHIHHLKSCVQRDRQ